jgi:hypothetical protein
MKVLFGGELGEASHVCIKVKGAVGRIKLIFNGNF